MVRPVFLGAAKPSTETPSYKYKIEAGENPVKEVSAQAEAKPQGWMQKRIDTLFDFPCGFFCLPR